MKPAPTIAIVTTSAARTGPRVAGLDAVVHVVEVAHEVDDCSRAPPEELLALLRRRFARRAPDAAALLQDRPERAGGRQEDGIDDRERARPQLRELRHEVPDAIHVAEAFVDR